MLFDCFDFHTFAEIIFNDNYVFPTFPPLAVRTCIEGENKAREKRERNKKEIVTEERVRETKNMKSKEGRENKNNDKNKMKMKGQTMRLRKK